ncbi:hypothetical protein [Austwickia sp. TVS 96-490-7B]|uniref:hypothetical protein n=1 Tax=Austwickia sp. TVS 96-490-7B TaxID=2830843 RepID=UPI001C55D108|nr:hypothetical protein [Austwickia sp. TVS 96-490-7B]
MTVKIICSPQVGGSAGGGRAAIRADAAGGTSRAVYAVKSSGEEGLPAGERPGMTKRATTAPAPADTPVSTKTLR